MAEHFINLHCNFGIDRRDHQSHLVEEDDMVIQNMNKLLREGCEAMVMAVPIMQYSILAWRARWREKPDRHEFQSILDYVSSVQWMNGWCSDCDDYWLGFWWLDDDKWKCERCSPHPQWAWNMCAICKEIRVGWWTRNSDKDLVCHETCLKKLESIND